MMVRRGRVSVRESEVDVFFMFVLTKKVVSKCD